MELPDNQRLRHTNEFSQVFVSGEKMIYYPPPRGRNPGSQTFSIGRTPEGEVVILNTMVNKLEYYTQNIRLLNIIHLNFIYIFDDSHKTDY